MNPVPEHSRQYDSHPIEGDEEPQRRVFRHIRHRFSDHAHLGQTIQMDYSTFLLAIDLLMSTNKCRRYTRELHVVEGHVAHGI
jgi:hypothetical protein